MNEVKVIITMQRQSNGSVNITRKIEGEGFHLFEIVGLLECAKKSMIDKSFQVAESIPKDRGEVKIKFVDE